MRNSLGVLSALLLPWLTIGCQSPSQRTISHDQSTELSKSVRGAERVPAEVKLSIDDVLDWRNAYGDLLDRPRDAAVERFGAEGKSACPNALDWSASSRTGDRGIGILCADGSNSAKIIAVRVYPKQHEALDVLDVVRRARLFSFGSGSFTDSVEEFFSAETKDRRNTFQFAIHGDDVSFNRVIFVSEVVLKRQ